jgi:hypothetical protein
MMTSVRDDKGRTMDDKRRISAPELARSCIVAVSDLSSILFRPSVAPPLAQRTGFSMIDRVCEGVSDPAPDRNAIHFWACPMSLRLPSI